MRILHLEDNPVDAQLIRETLESEGIACEIESVPTRSDFVRALQRSAPDLILADYTLPSFDGLSALTLAREKHPEVPFIFVTGTMGEDLAVESLKAGVTDYVLKNRLDRLGPAIRRALIESEERVARRRLEFERETLSTVIEQASESIVIADLDGKITYVNPSFESLSGYTREELIGKNPRILKSGRHASEFYEGMWQRLRQGKTWSGVIINKRKDGAFWEEETLISPVRDRNGAVIRYVAVARDLAERRRSEAETARLHDEVAEQKQQLESIIKNVPGVVWQGWGKPGDASQRIDFMSNYAEKLLGYTIAEWLSTPDFWFSIIDPEDKQRIAAEAAQHFARGEDGRMEFRWIGKDGRRVWVEARTTTIKDSGGRPAGTRGVNIDITERKTLEAQLRQAQKMEAIGALTGGIAHDFNNMLTVINGYSDLAIDGLNPTDPLRHKIEEIKKAGARAAALTRQLLIFSRKQVLQETALDLNSVIQETEKMLCRLIGENVELQTVLESEPGIIRADRGQIQQVVMNLAVNSRDAMPQGGRLTIETQKVILDGESPEYIDSRPGPYVMLSVSDTGTGMDPETQSHIFEPFFTTKEAGKGTGLGLATVYGIVRQANGIISVDSKVGQGTTFRIYFPLIGAEASQSQASSQPAKTDYGIETILLTEDDDAVRRLTRWMLEACGYRVLEAPTMEEALAVSQGETETIHLLLTDVIMPRGSGLDLARQLAQTRPETRVLYMSGYPDSPVVQKGVMDKSMFFIQKPFDVTALAQKVKEVLSTTP